MRTKLTAAFIVSLVLLGALATIPLASTSIRPLEQDEDPGKVKDKLDINWYLVRDGISRRVYNVSLEKKGPLKDKDISILMDTFISDTSFSANQVHDLTVSLGKDEAYWVTVIDKESFEWTDQLILDFATPTGSYSHLFENSPKQEASLAITYTPFYPSENLGVRVEVNKKFLGYLPGNETSASFTIDKSDMKKDTKITFTVMDGAEPYIIEGAYLGFVWGDHMEERHRWSWLPLTPQIIEADPSQVLHRYGEQKLKKDELEDSQGVIWFQVSFSAPIQRRTGYTWGNAGKVGFNINGTEFHPWWDSNWNYRKKLTFDNSGQSENLVNFAVLVHLNDSNIDWTHVNNSGQDIRFVDDDDSTELDYEIEEWDDTNDAWIWVNSSQIDSGSSTDFIYMYYGNTGAADNQNPTGVWDSNYIFVQHLQEASGTLYDSTANDNDADPQGSPTHGQTGKISDAVYMVGANYVRINNSATLDDIEDAHTFEFWVKLKDTDWGADCRIMGTYATTEPIIYSPSTELLRYAIWGGSVASSTYTFSDTDWHYVVAAFHDAGDIVRFWVDGSAAGTVTSYSSQVTTSATEFRLSENGGLFNGTLDEVRFSNTNRSASYAAAQYLSMTDDFITFASEETGATTTTTTSTAFTTDSYTGYTTTTTTSYTTTGEKRGLTTTTTTDGTFSTVTSTDGTIATTTTTTGSPTYTEIIRYTVSVAVSYSVSVTEIWVSTMTTNPIRKDAPNLKPTSGTIAYTALGGTTGVALSATAWLLLIIAGGLTLVYYQTHQTPRIPKRRKDLKKNLKKGIEGKHPKAKFPETKKKRLSLKRKVKRPNWKWLKKRF